MRIYIRHAEKEYPNGGREIFSHDPAITLEGRTQCTSVCKTLVERYGLPITIFVSPYLRTRQTGEVFQSVLLSEYGHVAPLYIERELSEYLGNHLTQDIRVETSIYHPPHPEKWSHFSQRIERHYERYSFLDKSNEVAWFITHGVVLSAMCRITCQKGFYPEPLDYIILSNVVETTP